MRSTFVELINQVDQSSSSFNGVYVDLNLKKATLDRVPLFIGVENHPF
ncbi:hypothetical protein ACKFKF_17445 [Phormidesmis sp. 146-12]